MVGGPAARYTHGMWHRRLSLGGFVLGVLLGACLVNCPPDHQGFVCRFAVHAATPLLIVLSPVIFLLSAAGLHIGHVAGLAGSSALTWTAVGYAASFFVRKRR